MSHGSADDLVGLLVSSPEFFQICIEVRRRLVTQSLEKSWLQQRLIRYLEQSLDPQLSQQQIERYYPALYVAVMQAIAQRSYMPTDTRELQQAPVPFADNPSVLVSEEHAALALEESVRLRNEESVQFSEQAASSWDGGIAIASSNAILATESRLDSVEPPELSQSQKSLEQGRYQTIVFEHSFYLLDRETGKTWLVKAGSPEMIPCRMVWPDTIKPEDRSEAYHRTPVLISSHSSVQSAHYEEAGEPYPPHKHGVITLSELTAEPSVDALQNHVDEQTPPSLEFLQQKASGATHSYVSLAHSHRKVFVEEQQVSALSFRDEKEHHSEGNLVSYPRRWSQQLTVLPSNVVTSEATEVAPRPEESLAWTPWHETIMLHYPYPIAYVYRAFMEEQDPRLRLRMLLVVFQQTLLYTTYPLIMQFLQDNRIHDLATYQALCELQSSRWGAWLHFLRCAAVSMKKHANPLNQAILQSFHRLETGRAADEKFLYTQRFLDPLGQERVTYLQLGLLEAMVLFRESFVHGFTPTPKQAEEELRVYEPLLFEILDQMDWMIKYPLAYTWRVGDSESYYSALLMGAGPSFQERFVESPSVRLLPEQGMMFLVDSLASTASFSLSPLIIADENSLQEPDLPHRPYALYLFDGCSGSRMLYHNLWQTPFSCAKRIDWWQKHLENKQFLPPVAQCSQHTLEQYTHAWTVGILHQLAEQQPFLLALAEERILIHRHIQDFLASESMLFVMHGGAGVGKTTVLAQIAQGMISKAVPVVWIRGREFESHDFLEGLVHILGLPVGHEESQPEDVARYLSPFLSSERPLVILVDDLTSMSDAREFLLELDQVMAVWATSLSNHVKCVVAMDSSHLWSMQSHTPIFAQSLDHTMTFEDNVLQLQSPTPVYELPPLTLEETAWLYDKYQSFHDNHGVSLFCPQTSWTDLSQSSSVRYLLRYPHLLRLINSTFCGQFLPESLELSDVMEHLVASSIEEKYAPLPVPERIQLLNSLADLLLQLEQDVISRQQLLQSQDPHIMRALQNHHIDSPLQQLLNLGILVEDWYAGKSSLRFSSSLVQSYFLWQRYCQSTLHENTWSLLDPAEPNHRYLLSKIHLFLWLHLLSHHQDGALVAWIHRHLNRVEPWLEEALVFLIRTDSSYWRMFFVALVKQECAALYPCIFRIVERLLCSGDESSASELLTLLSLHGNTTTTGLMRQSELLYMQARLLETLGRVDKARLLYEESLSLCAWEVQPLLHSQICMRLSVLARNRKRMDESMQWLETAQEKLQNTTDYKRWARLVRQQGNLAYEQGDLSQALICYQHSLRLDESCHHTRGMAASLSNLGTVFGSRSDFENALGHYHQALHFYQRLGDRKSVATTFHNIGIVYKIQQRWEEAVVSFSQALSLRKQQGFLAESIASLHHVASIYEQTGAWQEAVSALEEACNLQQQLGNAVGMAECLLHRGQMLYRCGREHDAMEQFQAILGLDPALAKGRYHAEAWYAIGQLRWSGGSFDSTLAALQEAENFVEQAEHHGLRAAIGRASAVALIETMDWDKAEQKLEDALSWAEDTFQPHERIECMMEWTHLCLLQKQIDATRALLERIRILQEDSASPQNSKDLLCLDIRYAVATQQQEQVEARCQQLGAQLSALTQDDAPLRTAWALYEAAALLQKTSPEQARTLAIHAKQCIARRTLSPRNEVDRLLVSLDVPTLSSPNLLAFYQADTSPSLLSTLAVVSSEDERPGNTLS